ncbi:MAG: ROK family protein [Acidobacteriota bacterium]|nr:ROK family protein [Acidobacteriota bacterium]
MKALAVDIGGSHISCAAVEDRELLQICSVEADSQGSLASVLPALLQTLSELKKQHGGNFVGMGFGFCGLVDGRLRRVVSTNAKYPDAASVDLVDWARKDLELPLALENDARLALLGERYAGAAQGSDDVVMMTLGTGIGTAAVMCGRPVRGKHFQAGCLGGHFTISAGGRLCSCGARGCFEAEASTYALPDVCRKWPGFETSALATEPKLDFETLFYCAELGDSVSKEIRARSIGIWAACALSLVHAYDPELLVVGGGVMKTSYPILDALQKHLDSYAWTPWGKVRVRAAALGSNAALLGAVPLLYEQNEI